MKELERSLGLVSVVAIGISAMLGAGLFVLPGIAATKTGPSVWLAYLLAGLTVLPTALCKAELATAMPASGGSYVYLDRLYGPLFGTVAGLALWASMLLKSTFALLGFGAYFRVFHQTVSDEQLKHYALVLLAVVVGLNLVGVKKLGKFQVAVVGATMVGMVFVVIFGLAESTPAAVRPALDHGFSGLLAATGFVFVAYNGVTKIAAIAEEIKQPARNLPLAILLCLLIVLVLYTLVAIALVGVIPMEKLTEGGAGGGPDLKPIHTLVTALANPTAGLIAAAIAVITMVSMANAGMLAASRFPFAMARDRLLPPLLMRVSARFKSPTASVIATGLVMALAIEFLEIERIAKLASAVVIMIFVMESVAVILFRESRVQWYKPGFRTPLYPVLPLLGIVGGLALLVMLGSLVLVAAAGVGVPGVALYWFYGRPRTERRGVVRKMSPRSDLLREPAPPLVEARDVVTSEAAVVVALFGQERSPEMLVELGAALADGRKVHATHLSEVQEGTDIDVMLEEEVPVQSLRRRIGAMAVERQLNLEFHAVVSRDLVRTVHAITSRVNCDWLIMSWQGRSRQMITSLSPIGWLVDHLESNLALFRDVGVRYVRKILVYPAPGPHDALVVGTADDLASTWNADVTLARFVPDGADGDVDSEKQYLAQLARLCHATTERVVVRGKHKVRAMTEFTGGFDFLVMGAPTTTLRNLLKSPVEERITARAVCSVLTVKTPRIKTHEAFSRSPASVPTPRHTLRAFIEPPAVAARLPIAQKSQLFQLLAETFAGVYEGTDERTIMDAFLEREREQSTAVGRGVALPHATVNDADRSVVGVFTTSKPIDYDAPDGGPVDVFFAMMGPASDRETHLRLLSGIARLSLKTDLLARLREADSKEAILEAIDACAAKLTKLSNT